SGPAGSTPSDGSCSAYQSALPGSAHALAALAAAALRATGAGRAGVPPLGTRLLPCMFEAQVVPLSAHISTPSRLTQVCVSGHAGEHSPRTHNPDSWSHT